MISDVMLDPQQVASELRPVLLRLSRELRKETEQLGVTARQATLLWLVKRSPGLSLAELAAEEGISPPALSGHVDRLESAGLLERVRSTDDRRRVGLQADRRGHTADASHPGATDDVARGSPAHSGSCRAEGRGSRDSRAATPPSRERMTSLAIALRTRTFRSLRRHRNYRIFFYGQLVSLAGSWMQNIALAWLVLELSGSPLAIGALAFCRFVPFTVFGLAAGVVADRMDTRRLVMATQGAALIVSIALAVVTLTGTATLTVVYVLAALGGITLAFDAPGRQSLTYQMVGPRSLPNAVALNAGLFNGSRVIGPAIAGVVIALAGTGICFVINAFSFLAVLVALSRLRAEEFHHVERDPSARSRSRACAGRSRTCAASPQLRAVFTVVAIVSTVGFNFHVLVPLLAGETLHVGPEGFGLLSASFGLGALVGALVTATFRNASWKLFATGATGFGILALALAPVVNAVLAGVLLFAVGISFTLFTANANALVQLGAPDHLRGRMIGLYLFAFVGLAPVGGLLTGWLADLGGTPLAFAVAGVTSLLTIGVASLRRARSSARS